MTIKPGWNGRFFEDFAIGDVYQHPLGRTVTTTDNMWFTLLTQNVANVHFDAHYAAKTEFDPRRLYTALVLIPSLYAIIRYLPPMACTVLAFVIAALALTEFYRLCLGERASRLLMGIGYGITGLWFAGYHLGGLGIDTLFLAVVLTLLIPLVTTAGIQHRVAEHIHGFILANQCAQQLLCTTKRGTDLVQLAFGDLPVGIRADFIQAIADATFCALLGMGVMFFCQIARPLGDFQEPLLGQHQQIRACRGRRDFLPRILFRHLGDLQVVIRVQPLCPARRREQRNRNRQRSR